MSIGTRTLLSFKAGINYTVHGKVARDVLELSEVIVASDNILKRHKTGLLYSLQQSLTVKGTF